MLPSKERLNRAAFAELLTSPNLTVIFNRLGTLKYTSSPARALSVVIGSKHEKRAVARNKLRRRAYAVFQQNRSPIKGILYASKGASVFSYDELKNLLNDLLAKTQKNTK